MRLVRCWARRDALAAHPFGRGESCNEDLSDVGNQSKDDPERASHWAALMNASCRSGQNCSDFLLRLRKPPSESPYERGQHGAVYSTPKRSALLSRRAAKIEKKLPILSGNR